MEKEMPEPEVPDEEYQEYLEIVADPNIRKYEQLKQLYDQLRTGILQNAGPEDGADRCVPDGWNHGLLMHASKVEIQQVNRSACRNRSMAYRTHLISRVRKPSGREDTVSDSPELKLWTALRDYDDAQVKRLVESDLVELKNSCRTRSLKCILGMSGSILETIVIDWASELDGKNYFRHPMRVSYGKRGPRDANLKNYIDHVSFLLKPDWNAEKEKADEIRRLRNLFHPAESLKEKGVTEDKARKALDDLKDILEARGIGALEEGLHI